MEKIEELIDELSQINDENKDEKIRAVCNLVREIMIEKKPLIIAGDRFLVLNGMESEITKEFAKCLIHNKNLLSITLNAAIAATEVINKK